MTYVHLKKSLLGFEQLMKAFSDKIIQEAK